MSFTISDCDCENRCDKMGTASFTVSDFLVAFAIFLGKITATQWVLYQHFVAAIFTVAVADCERHLQNPLCRSDFSKKSRRRNQNIAHCEWSINFAPFWHHQFLHRACSRAVDFVSIFNWKNLKVFYLLFQPLQTHSLTQHQNMTQLTNILFHLRKIPILGHKVNCNSQILYFQ